jgi:hypothetical protein
LSRCLILNATPQVRQLVELGHVKCNPEGIVEIFEKVTLRRQRTERQTAGRAQREDRRHN